MNFKNAIELKKKLGKDKIKEGKITFIVFVTPAEVNDFRRYIEDYRSGHFTDESSKNYSTNGKFKVCGLWTNGADVFHNDLT